MRQTLLRPAAPGHRGATAWLALLLATAALPGCTDERETAPTEQDAAVAGDSSGGAAADGGPVDDGNAAFKARGSVHQVYVTHAQEGDKLQLRDASANLIAEGVADHLGSLVMRKLPAGSNYRVYLAGATPPQRSGPLTVWTVAQSQPPQSLYDEQVIKPGNGYIKTRDGTTLAYFATLPGPPEKGPYPTIVNYSGYDPARPGAPVVPKNQESFCEAVPVLCNAPSDPSAMFAAVTGYATVSVNIRGTGCSGGAYDYFETMQLLDGYDVIETVAAQKWVAHHKVGMTGLSYPGITQLFVAKMRPPSLAAITPLSVIGNTVTTLVPGGILNKGFALSWIDAVYNKAAPYGQGWEKARVTQAGDYICEENQLLHDQRVNNVEQAKSQTYYDPEIVDPLNPTLFADKINVPVFLAGSWQDEQTGPYFHTLLDQFKSAPSRRFFVYNGVHPDGFAPQIIAEWKAFLDIYVARAKPTLSGFFTLLVPQVTQALYGAAIDLPPDRWADVKDWQSAKKKWESEPPLQAIFENGGKPPYGTPQGVFRLDFDQWPPKQTKPRRWFFQPGGKLAAMPIEATEAVSFRLDPTAGGRGILGKGPGINARKPAYKWRVPKPGYAVYFTSAPLKQDLVMLGTGSVDLWLRSPSTKVDDADLEVNLTEVRPDGQEMYVQSGWLRASYSKLLASSTELWPEPDLLPKQISKLAPGQWRKVRVAIAGFSHVFRAGSRIRIAVDTPGDSRARWRFELLTFDGDAHYHIGQDKARASSVVLPVIAGASTPAGAALPPCPSLRGQQCRKLVSHPNVTVPL